MNNFEKIRNMTVDEMAEWLIWEYKDKPCHEVCNGCDNYAEIGCVEGTKQWLQQESEG